jgi:hypothetical protein
MIFKQIFAHAQMDLKGFFSVIIIEPGKKKKYSHQ